MILNIYTIRDLKTDSFRPPFFARHHGEATRMVQTLVNEVGSQLNVYSQDFTLIGIGAFDDETAEITPCEPAHVCDLSSLYFEETER